ncbi:hypothetical protein C8F01DRAFT_656675 [Mycena amicta]|nr:hypothetical protein C8F01DRAFT_656675 [Mycena amicta]
MLLSQLLFLGVYAILVVATDGLLLNDAQGQNPCEMQKTFQDGCPTSRRDTNSTQITSCTCTNVYFNLWSACVFIQNHLDNTTLPPCEDFLQNCTNSAIRVTNWTDDPSKGYPRWVYMALPSNGQTFDIAAAIESATPPSHKWTIVQIVLPIIVGLAVAAAILVVFVCYRRRKRSSRNRPWMQTTGNRARFHFPALTNIVKVRELNRSTSWSIDEREEPMDEYQFVSAPNSIQGSQASGHVRLSSSSSGTHPPPLAITTGQAVPARAWPGRSLWIGPYSRAKRLFDTVPLPWRSAKRVHVKNMGSYNKFRVDSDDSDSPLSQRTHESIMAAAGRSQSNLRNETLFEPEEDSDSETEGLPLMSHEQGRRAHGAENLAPRPDAFSPQGANPLRSPRQIPPTSAPPRIPLPLPPPKPFQVRHTPLLYCFPSC